MTSLRSSGLSILPLQIIAGLSEADKAELLAKWDRADGECCVCLDAAGADVAVLTRCGHGPMCRECIEGHLQSQVRYAQGLFAPLTQRAHFAIVLIHVRTLGHICAAWLHLRTSAGRSVCTAVHLIGTQLVKMQQDVHWLVHVRGLVWLPMRHLSDAFRLCSSKLRFAGAACCLLCSAWTLSKVAAAGTLSTVAAG